MLISHIWKQKWMAQKNGKKINHIFTSGTLSGTFPIHDRETIEQSHFAFVFCSKCKCIAIFIYLRVFFCTIKCRWCYCCCYCCCFCRTSANTHTAKRTNKVRPPALYSLVEALDTIAICFLTTIITIAWRKA